MILLITKAKGLFYDAVERELGLEFSKEIRLTSRLKSKKENPVSLTDNIKIEPVMLIKQEHAKEPVDLLSIDTNLKNVTDLLALLQKECKGCPVLKKITEKYYALDTSKS